ncbi:MULTISPECIES: hypothetical protein [Arthrobacter]|uniref:Uncharacterized protein n=1 Tax=Arthrobacter nanjingensis TaxID=1387716 RepID=A0ABU9KNW2_9MICC|nr:hypothetical protein [Arthrobacter sp. YJM1]
MNSPLLRGSAVPLAGEEIPIIGAEVRSLVTMALSRGATSVTIGSGRDLITRASARTIADAWSTSGHGVAVTIDWPETAASWLRPANRFAAASTDLWIMLGPPLGWAQMTRRLLWSTPWKPSRTLLTGGVSDPRALELVGLHNLTGIAGTTRAGSAWHLSADNRIITTPESGS